jgi:hypothetical protein
MSKTAFITCGALGREVVAIIKKNNWNVDVIGISAQDHMFPARIAPDVEKRYLEIRDRYDRVIVVFGDCGSRGALDALLEKYDLERVAGPHCYEMYGGSQFDAMMDAQPGTFFLTDFLVRAFNGTVMKGLGLDRYPELKEDYFRHYTQVVYYTQEPDAKLSAKAETIAAYLELPLEIHPTGYGLLETRLVELMANETSG